MKWIKLLIIVISLSLPIHSNACWDDDWNDDNSDDESNSSENSWNNGSNVNQKYYVPV